MKKLIIFLLLICCKINPCLSNMIISNKTNKYLLVEFQAQRNSSYMIDTQLIEPNSNYIQLKGIILSIIIYIYDTPNIDKAELLQKFSDIQNPNTKLYTIEEKRDKITLKSSVFSTKI